MSLLSRVGRWTAALALVPAGMAAAPAAQAAPPPALAAGVVSTVTAGATSRPVAGAAVRALWMPTIPTFHNTAGATGTWTYGQTADSTIDTAFSYTSATYGWTVSGNYHIGATESAWQSNTTAYNYDRYVRTYFEYHQGHIDGPYTDPACEFGINGLYAITAEWWNGGAADDGYTFRDCYTLPQDYRTVEYRGYRLGVNTSTATRIGYAIDVWGVHLGAVSGYSHDMSMSWNVTGPAVLFCGLHGTWGHDPGVIYDQPASMTW